MMSDPAQMSSAEAEKYDEMDREEYEASAHSIIACTDVLELFADTISPLVAGERTSVKLLYLLCTSSLTPFPMHGIVKGLSSAGKSNLVTSVLRFLPPERVVTFDVMSDKALFYLETGLVNKVLYLGEAAGTEEKTQQDMILRLIMSEGKAKHLVNVHNKETSHWGAVELGIEGPCSFVTTTTQAEIHAENETRVWSIFADESPEQTRQVMLSAARSEGLGEATNINFEPWHAFQKWLALRQCEVVVPFAEELALKIPPAAVRLRRDFKALLRAIKTHALIHRQHRETDDKKRIIADIDHDYAAVRELAHAIVAANAGVAVDDEMRKVVEAVSLLTAGERESFTVTVLMVAEKIERHKSTASRWLRKGAEEGYLNNLQEKPNQKGMYRLGDKNLPDASYDVLPHPDALKSAQPCNRSPLSEQDQEHSGCTRSATVPQPSDTGVERLHDGCTESATVRTLNYNAKNMAVARLHGEEGCRPESHIELWHAFNVRAASLEFEGGLSREEAEAQASEEFDGWKDMSDWKVVAGRGAA